MLPQIQPLTLADLSECQAIVAELNEHYDHPIGGEWTADKILAELEAHHGWGVFDSSQKLQAFCLFRRPEALTREIMLLATRPRDHRSGAMRTLIRSLIGDLAADEQIWLEVHAGNLPAIGLYESLGFKLVGERKDYYYDGGKALLYEYKPLQ